MNQRFKNLIHKKSVFFFWLLGTPNSIFSHKHLIACCISTPFEVQKDCHIKSWSPKRLAVDTKKINGWLTWAYQISEMNWKNDEKTSFPGMIRISSPTFSANKGEDAISIMCITSMSRDPFASLYIYTVYLYIYLYCYTQGKSSSNLRKQSRRWKPRWIPSPKLTVRSWK